MIAKFSQKTTERSSRSTRFKLRKSSYSDESGSSAGKSITATSQAAARAATTPMVVINSDNERPHQTKMEKAASDASAKIVSSMSET